MVFLKQYNSHYYWYSQDTNTLEETLVENVAYQFGLHQIMKEPTHILENSF